MIDVFGQEIFIKLQSPVWQDRDSALQTITTQIDEFTKKDQYQEAFNQMITLFAYNEKNQQAQNKYLHLFRSMPDEFKFDSQLKIISLVLEKYVDARTEKSAEQTFIKLAIRNHNEDFSEVLGFIVSKQSYFNT